ncbi:hypothetical protein MTR67_017788 [Solanum verrucosum]|uniref:Uncharacterized protein n=1 Tax=Solanum verrucosum TaxID=315347 RepID=A0AAF0QJU2_SOLVR|nr:hypothetical protein MTR67_017788 [Solanum verrucosum]
MPNDGHERLNSKFSITIQRIRYLELNNSELKNFNDTTHYKNAQLIRFMRNYGHELLNSRNQRYFSSQNTQGYSKLLKLIQLRNIQDAQFVKFMRNLWERTT